MRREQKPLIISLIVVSLILTALFLVFSSERIHRAQSEHGLLLTHRNDDDNPERTPQLISATATSPSRVDAVILHYRSEKEREFHRMSMQKVGPADIYVASLPGLSMGHSMDYYLEATDEAGGRVVLPKGVPQGRAYHVAFEGKPWMWARQAHVLLMLASFILFLHALYYAVFELQMGGGGGKLYWTILWADVCFSISGLPLGWLIAHQVHGVAWTGIPFGWNITDNKTVIVFLYWTIVLILRKTGKISERSLAKLALYGLILTVVVFLIPHGI